MAKQLGAALDNPTEVQTAAFVAVVLSFLLGVYVGFAVSGPTTPPENCQQHIATIPARVGEPVQRWQVTTCQVKL